MTIEETLASFVNYSYEGMGEEWAESQNCFSAEEVKRFLTEDYVTGILNKITIPKEVQSEILGEAETIAKDENLLRLMHHCRYWAIGRASKTDLRTLVPHENKFNNGLVWFELLLGFSLVEQMFARHRELGIPEEVGDETLYSFGAWSQTYFEISGHWGFERITWLDHHLNLRLFKIGRLEYMLKDFEAPVHAFYNQESGECKIFYKGDTRFRKDGQLDGVNDIIDTENAWTSVYEETADKVTGTPVNIMGFAEHEPLTLSLEGWKKIASPEHWMMDIHIPAYQNLAPEICGESLRKAKEFFRKYFPDQPATCCYCGSWLLDPQLAELLKPESKIVTFQKGFQLFPINAGEAQAVDRIFGQYPIDLDKAPRDTSLQKAAYEFMKSGRRFRGTGGIIPVLDGPQQWGKNYSTW